jgi:hypothetical protein
MITDILKKIGKTEEVEVVEFRGHCYKKKFRP